MILRVYEPYAKFGEETVAYHDFKCDDYQMYDGVLRLFRFKGNDLFIPLTSVKIFEERDEVVEPTKQLTDSDLQDEVVL